MQFHDFLGRGVGRESGGKKAVLIQKPCGAVRFGLMLAIIHYKFKSSQSKPSMFGTCPLAPNSKSVVVVVTCTFDEIAAAVCAGAVMDARYHPGVWRSVKYTCCDAINKHAAGCAHTTPNTADDAETDIDTRSSYEPPPRPVKPPKKRKMWACYSCQRSCGSRVFINSVCMFVMSAL